ncbi:uncharacterized protein [Onthophagus taurus]|uniref:uncharacterized protein n=1 Tax=Onthophagus taurus TaxID=166361 RepID=UPI0039BDA407
MHRSSKRSGRGIVNTLINKLPIELHLPGYNYCGPGTKLVKRLVRGDRGVNKLDDACKTHDIAYAATSNLAERHIADKELYKTAKERLRSKDASLGERLSSALVSTIMKGKTIMGMGMQIRALRRRGTTRQKLKRGGKLSFTQAMNLVRRAIAQTNSTNTKGDVQVGYNLLKPYQGRILKPRGKIIKIPKTGGFLPLILAALGALGSLGGGAAAIAKTVNEAKIAREQLQEAQRHNRAMEPKAIGSGLYIKPYKQGCGLVMKTVSRKSKRLKRPKRANKIGTGMFINPYKKGCGYKTVAKN